MSAPRQYELSARYAPVMLFTASPATSPLARKPNDTPEAAARARLAAEASAQAASAGCALVAQIVTSWSSSALGPNGSLLAKPPVARKVSVERSRANPPLN